jgi:hypothetical protein
MSFLPPPSQGGLFSYLPSHWISDGVLGVVWVISGKHFFVFVCRGRDGRLDFQLWEGKSIAYRSAAVLASSAHTVTGTDARRYLWNGSDYLVLLSSCSGARGARS